MAKSDNPESIINDYLSPILSDIDIGIALIDSDGIIQWANQRMVDWFGPRERLIPFPCRLICQDNKDNCCIDIIDEDRTSIIHHISHVSKDGETRYFKLTTSLIKNPPIDGIKFIMLAHETTEIQLSKISQQLTETRMRTILDSAHAGIILTDLDGKIINANQEFLRLFGVESAHEFSKNDGVEWVMKDMQPKVDNMRRLLVSGKQVQDIKVVLNRKDGSSFLANLSATSLKNADGEPHLLLVSVVDSTDMVRGEKTQEAIYQIASAAGSAARLEEIYPVIHEIIQGIMPAQNFYIALNNKTNQTINFPYFVDRFDQPENEVPYDDKTITAYVLRTGRSLLCTKEVSLELERQGEVDMAGTEPEIWLGAPLILDNETIGVIAMQHYDDPAAYTTQDQRILEFVSTEVAKAIHSKRTEKALLESERRFRSVVEASPFGLHLYRLMPDGRLILIATNQSADEILGINHSELIGKTIEEAFPGLADSNIPEEYRKAAAEGIFWKSRQYNYEDDMIQGVFEIFAFQISPNEMAALFQDITDRIKTESALVESEKRFRSVVESSPLAIFIYHLAENEDLILLDSNPAADEVFGLDCKQYIGKKIEDAFPALAGVEAMDIYRRIARSGGVWQSDDVHYQGDKTASAFELFAFQISPQRVAVMYQDVTNRLKNEEEIRRLNEELEERVATRTVELQAANREMEAFAYSVSHDLRAPVRSIKGFSELLIAEKDDLSGQEFEDLLRRIYNSSIKMDELIDDLLSLSYLEKQKLKIRSINLSEIVEKICEQVGEEFPDAQFRTVINKTPDIRADKSMVTIMLTNLLTNAFKFTADQPKPTITFGSKHHGNEATFYLHDNGIGFEMEYAEKIFAPFERLHPSEYDGTGIGLAIARRVIQRHNGRIWAVSKLGEGTTFYFSLGTQEMIG